MGLGGEQVTKESFSLTFCGSSRLTNLGLYWWFVMVWNCDLIICEGTLLSAETVVSY